MIDDIETGIPTQKYVPPTEEDSTGTWWEGTSATWDLMDVEYGEGYIQQARKKGVEALPDYKENQSAYDRYIDNSDFLASERAEELDRHWAEKGIDSGRWTLDANGDVVDSKKTWVSSYVFDYDLIKGTILARQAGFSKEAEKIVYQDIVNAEKQRLQKLTKNNSLGQTATGVIGSFATRPEFVKEVAASPAKIVGKTIASGALKAFSTEFTASVIGEMDREDKFYRHKQMMDEEYTLWDSTLNIITNSTVAGTFRMGGSIVADKWLLRGIKDEVAKSAKLEAEVIKHEGKQAIREKSLNIVFDGTDRETLNRFVRREEFKLTKDTNLHIDTAYKAEYDLNNGNKVDVEEHLDIDGDEKFNTVGKEETNIEAEVKSNYSNIEKDIEDIQKEVDEVKPVTEIKIEDPYEGRVDKATGDELIMTEGLGDELAQIEKQINKLTQRQLAVKEASEIPIGGSEDEAKQAVKNLFKKNTSEEARYKSMSKEDIAEVERMAMEDLIASKPADMTDDEWVEANKMFAKGIDNLVAGTVAGIETDEQGNITFDAEKFVLGLGGYTAVKAILTNPKVQSELKGWAERAINELETNPKFDMVTGTQRVVENNPKVAKAIDKTTRDSNFKKWFSGSKAVDDKGEPLIVYHGTKGNFEKFDISKGGSATRSKDGKEGFFFSPSNEIAGEYADFANNANWAKYETALDDWKSKKITYEDFKKIEEWFSGLSMEETSRTSIANQNIMPVYLDIKNPKIIDHMKQYNEEAFKFEIPYAKEQGHDGIIFKNIEDRVSGGEWRGLSDTYVVFQSNQIKSINNKGAFSKDGNILKGALTIPAVGLTTASQKEETK